jgi:hypothetical protein
LRQNLMALPFAFIHAASEGKVAAIHAATRTV